MKKIFLLIFCLAPFIKVTAQLFSQDFSSSSTLSDYFSSSPNSGQFNTISTANAANNAVSITNGKLQYSRTGASSASFSRTTDFSPVPSVVKYAFKLAVSGNTSATTTTAVFQIGSGFGTSNSAEVIANVHSRFGINFTATDGTFTLRDIGGSSNSSSLVGEQQISWYINNSGSSISYNNPNSTITTLADDKADIWAGTTLVLSNINATTSSQTLADLKFAFTAGTGTITIDDFIITYDNAVVLNIELANLSVKKIREIPVIIWQTTSETNNAYFEIQHSTDAKTFETIGQIKGNGTTYERHDYSYEHQTPSVGVNYYRLRQVDFDGKESFSNIVSALANTVGKLKVYPTVATDILTISSEGGESQTYYIVDILGRIVQSGLFFGQKELNVNDLSAGWYVLKVNEKAEKFVKN